MLQGPFLIQTWCFRSIQLYSKSYNQPKVLIFLHSSPRVVFLVLPPSVASAVAHFRPPIVRYGTAWFTCTVPHYQSASYLAQSFTLTRSGFTRVQIKKPQQGQLCTWWENRMTYCCVLMDSGKVWPLTSSCSHRQLQVSPRQRWEVTKYQYFVTTPKYIFQQVSLLDYLFWLLQHF